MTHAGKLDHVGVGAYSTLAGGGARHFCPRLCINKIPEFYVIFARKKVKKIPKFYTRHLPENARILHCLTEKYFSGIFSGEGEGNPLPRLLCLWLGPRPPSS